MGSLRGDFVLTPEAEATYREVRRYYADRDVRGYLEDHGLAADGYELELIVDRYDRWQGDNEEWYPALGTIVDDVLGDGAEPVHTGISIHGELQQFDLWGNRCDLWKADFTVPDPVARRMPAHVLEGLIAEPRFCGPGDGPTALCLLCKRSFEVGAFGAGTSWEWGDPCDLRVDEDDVRAYLAHLGEG